MMSTDKPIKPSDSVIDYPDISKESVKVIQDQIAEWVGGHDFYAASVSTGDLPERPSDHIFKFF